MTTRSTDREAPAPESASPWVVRWAALIEPSARVLDLACGAGRHARFLAARGHHVTAVDRDAAALADLADTPGITALCRDLEDGPWPFDEREFGAVVVTNYLYRPRLPLLLHVLERRGVLVYETFARGNERFGRPRNPDFLLFPGELLDVCRAQCRIVAYEDVEVDRPRPAMVQRIVAVRID